MCRLLAIAVLLLVACTREAEPPREIALAIEPTAQLDLLFMIDNSASPTGSIQFSRGVAVLLAELSALPGGGPDLHAGVVSSDLGAGRMPLGYGSCARVGGDRGVLQTKPSCGGLEQRYVSAAPGMLASAAERLSCMMDLGVAGC